PTTSPSTPRNEAVRSDFDEHLWNDQPADSEHRRRRTYLTEDRPLRLPGLLPIASDVHQIDARPHNVPEARAGSREHRLDVLQGLDGLGVSIPDTHEIPVVICRRGAGHPDVTPDSYGARIADDGLPPGAGGKIFTRRQLGAPLCSTEAPPRTRGVPSGRFANLGYWGCSVVRVPAAP